jgi:hypothetical protein
MFERVNDSGVSVKQLRLELDVVQRLLCSTAECTIINQLAKDTYNKRHDECSETNNGYM